MDRSGKNIFYCKRQEGMRRGCLTGEVLTKDNVMSVKPWAGSITEMCA